MQEIHYRQLLPSDHDEYRRVRLSCLQQYPDNFGSTYEEEQNAGSLKLSKAINEPDDHNFVFGAFDAAGQLIGICGFVSEPRLKTQHRGEIVQMFVEPAYNGQGAGKELLQRCIVKAFANDRTEQIILSAVASNQKAVALYKQVGFVEYGRLENYFKWGNTCTTQTFLYLDKPGTK